MGEEEERAKETQEGIDDMLGDMLEGGSTESSEDEGESENEEDSNEETGDAEETGEEESEEEDSESSEKGEKEEAESSEAEESEEDSEGDDGAEEGEEEDERDTIIAKLREELADKKAVEMGGEEEEKQKEEEEQAFSVLGEESLEGVLDNPDKFNQVIGTALDKYGTMITRKILTSLPRVVMEQVKQQGVIRTAVSAFYEENEDLKGYRKLVGATVNEVVAEKPEWKMDKVFTEAADRTRNVLGLKKVAQEKKGKKNPSFAKPKGKSGKSEVKTPKTNLQKDIDILIS